MKGVEWVHFTPFVSAGFCSVSGMQMNAMSEKVTSAASSGAKMPSVTSCCMISCACCSRREWLSLFGSEDGTDENCWSLSIVLQGWLLPLQTGYVYLYEKRGTLYLSQHRLW